MYPAAVHYFGPGATPQQQADAAYAQQPGFYAGFGTSKPKVYNWLGSPQPQVSFQDSMAEANAALMARQSGGGKKQSHQSAAPRQQFRYDQSVLRPQPATPPPAPQPTTPAPTPQPTAPTTAPIDWQPFLDSLSGMFGGGGMAPAPPQINVSSGITAGPVYNPAQAAAAQSQMQRLATRPLSLEEAAGVPMSDTQRGSLTGSYGTAANNAARIAGTDLGRDISYANAQNLLASEKARAASGVDWGQLGAREYELGLFQDMANRNRQLSLLEAIGGMFV